VTHTCYVIMLDAEHFVKDAAPDRIDTTDIAAKARWFRSVTEAQRYLKFGTIVKLTVTTEVVS
jgi:hypothetical protein